MILIFLLSITASFASENIDDQQITDVLSANDDSIEESLTVDLDGFDCDVESQSENENLAAVDNDGVLREGQGNFTELKELIDSNTNGTVDLYKDYLKVPQDQYEGIAINKPLTIDGHGHILNANNNGGIFAVSTTSKMVFKNITFMNSTNIAISFSNKATVDFLDCNFIDNYRESRRGIYGAAVTFNKGLVDSTFDNVLFRNNTLFMWESTSSIYGAAICIVGDATNNTFRNMLFSKNRCTQENFMSNNLHSKGAAICFLGKAENNRFINSTFYGNYVMASISFPNSYHSDTLRSYPHGGAIYFDKDAKNNKFLDCNFTKNRAELSGGAIYFNTVANNCSFVGTLFDSNYQSYDSASDTLVVASAGAIFFKNAIDTVFNDTQFVRNHARWGGAIYLNQGNGITFVDTNFTENYALSQFTDYRGGKEFPYQTPYGGALYIKNTKFTTFENVNFIENSAYDSNPSWTGHDENTFRVVGGGAVYISSSSNFTFKDVLFSGNHAKNNGGAFIGTSLTNFTFENVDATDNDVASNENNHGGAFYISNANNIYFTDVNFEGNSIVDKFSYYYGSSYTDEALGAVLYLFSNNNVYFSNVNFTDNLLKADCDSFGKAGDKCLGIVYLTGSNFTFDNVNFVNNTYSGPYGANAGGSAIASAGELTGLKLTHVLFENSTSQSKGAVCLIGTTSDVLFNNTIFENSAGKEGAAIYMSANGVEILNTVINNTIASGDGGAVYITGSNYFIDNVKIINTKLDETATAKGVAMFCSISDSTVTNVDFINNTADSTGSNGVIYSTILSSVLFKNINVIDNSVYDGGIFVIKSDKTYTYYSKNVTIVDSTFANNTVGSSSMTAVISTDSPINITHDIITDNDGVYATILHNYNRYRDELLVVDSSVLRKSDGEYVIYVKNAQAYINNIDFANHTGSQVIYIYSSKDSLISNCNFTNNTCNDGAVYLYGYSNNPTTMENVRFINNSASGSGGAISAYSAGLILNGAYFENSSAGETGGTINAQFSTLQINNANITNSHARYGGAVYSYGCSLIDIADLTVINSSALENGGAISIDYANCECTMVNSEFENCTGMYGGAIYLGYNVRLDIDNANFTNNNASVSGGAIYSGTQSTLNINNSCFYKNTAALGSAIDTYGALDVANSEFMLNKANSTSLVIDFNRYSNETNVSYTGGDNYINAIQSSEDITLTNVNYYDYETNGKVNTNDKPAVNSYYIPNQRIVIQVYDEEDNLLETFVRNTDSNGKIYIDTVNGARHHMVAYREDDDYYTYIDSYFLCRWGDFTILQRLINSLHDNDVLDLTRDYTYTIGADEMTEGIIINRTNITINGNGFKINALYKSRIFELLTDGVTFNDINFANASGLEGAFIHGIDVNNTEINGCTFMNTFDFDMEDYVEQITSNEHDPWYEPPFDESSIGTAVYIIGNQLDVLNSNFTYIIGRIAGSIYFEGNDTSIINSKFNYTLADFGGAILLNANNATTDYCEFYNTIAQYAGGAVLALGNDHSIDHSIFNGCYLVGDYFGYMDDIDGIITTKDDYVLPDDIVPGSVDYLYWTCMGGGAIYSEADNMNISHSSFDCCSSHSVGGAIYADGNNTQMNYCNFTNANATTGGAVFMCNNASNSLVMGCLFDNDAATINGGAISWYAENGTLKDSTFINNRQIVDMENYDYYNNPMCGGGAVFWYGKNAVIDNCDFTNNTVCPAYGDYVDPEYDVSYDQIQETKIEYSSGGAMLIRGHTINITNCNFTDNSAQSGGAISILNYNIPPLNRQTMEELPADINLEDVVASNVNIIGCNFDDNFAQYAGAVLINGYKNNIYDSEFTNNTALVGGAVNLRGISSVVSNSKFKDNKAFIAGALLSGCMADDPWYGSYTLAGYNNTVKNSTFADNYARGSGAVLWLDEDGAIKENCKFIGNEINNPFDCYAEAFKEAYNIELTEELFEYISDYFTIIPSETYALDIAGAILWNGYNGLVEDTEISESSAHAGSAVVWFGPEGTINNSTIKHNIGYELVSGSSKDYKIITHSIVQSETDYWSTNPDKTWRLDELYQTAYDEVSQIYGEDISLIHKYYYRTLTGTSSYNSNRYYNTTYNYVFFVNSGDSQLVSDSSIAVVAWIGENGLINDTKFIDNTASMGGALFNTAYNLVVNNSQFINNSAHKGGAVYWNGEEGIIDRSVFEDNKGFSEIGGNSWRNYTYIVVNDSVYSSERWPDNKVIFANFQEILDSLYETYKFDCIVLKDYYYNYNQGEEGYLNVSYAFEMAFDIEGSFEVPSAGGAIYWDGYYSSINNSEFTNNDAFEGGAVYIVGINSEINNSTFRNNHAIDFYNTYSVEKEKIIGYDAYFDYYGYSYDIDYKDFVIDNLEEVLNNISKLYGTDLRYEGFVYEIVESGEPDESGYSNFKVKVTYVVTLRENEVCSKPLGSAGAAVYVAGETNLINNCSFIENNASVGGALFVDAPDIIVNDSTFEENTAYQSNTIRMVEDTKQLTHTIPTSRYEFYSRDEAVSYANNLLYQYILGLQYEYDVDVIRFTYNIRIVGWNGDMQFFELYPIDVNVSLINYVESVDNKSCGGAAYINVADILINESRFNSNNAEFGGAVFINGENINVLSSEFKFNDADFGGAIFTNKTNTLIENSLFELNNALQGGAIRWDGQSGSVISSRFLNNTALSGGAIYCAGDDNQITNNSLFRYNKADTGSALYVTSNGMVINSSTLLENQAKSDSITFESEVIGDELYVHVTFTGNDNFINAIYTLNEIELNEVTYCPINSENEPVITDLEDGINITLKISDYETSVLRTFVNLTNFTGESTFVIPVVNGRYLLALAHKEDNYYTEISTSDYIYVGTLPVEMEISAENIYYKENATVTVKVPVYVTGNITINIDGQNLTPVAIKDGLVSVEIPNLKGGTHNVTAYYNGGGNFVSNSTNTTFSVLPIKTSIVISAEDGDYNTPIPVNISIEDADVTGSVIITIKDVYGSTLIITDSNKLATTISGLAAGTYNISALYTGDNSYLNATNMTTFTVSPIDLDASASAKDVTVNENASILINVPDDFVGKANVTVGDITRTYDIVGPTRVLFDKLPVGDKVAKVALYGDDNYNDANLTAAFKVSDEGGIFEMSTVKSDDMIRGWGSPYDYQAAFLDDKGEALANQYVLFKVNGKEYKVKTNDDGIAQLTTSQLAVGSYKITSINLVTGEQATNNLEIVGRIQEANDLVMDFRDGSEFVVKVIGDDGNVAKAGEVVSVTINGVSYPVTVGEDGYARLTINLNPKTYSVTTEYKSFKVNNKVVVKQTLFLVKKAITIKKGNNLALQAKLKWSNGKVIVGKVIKFRFYGKTYTAKTNRYGIAKVIIKGEITKKLRTGATYKYSATYITNILKGSVVAK